jgi:tRNA threonylcarbamoyladenosine biosynthesis protein TsaB
MIILGLDTSTLTASVAVVRDGDVVAAVDVATRAHGDVLLAAIDEVVRAAGMTAANLDAIATGAGPGSFTGLRIGMATAKGIAFAAGRPLYVISSLAALAADAADAGAAGAAGADGIGPDTLIVPALDARRGEVYVGFYRGGTAVAPERVLAPGALIEAIAGVRGDTPTAAVIVGDAVRVYALAAQPGPGIASRGELRETPSGAAVARLASIGTHRDALTDGAPQYIRQAEAEILYPNGVPGALRRR